MKNIFLAFIFIVLSFTAHFVFAQDNPAPSCNGSVVAQRCTAAPNYVGFSCPVGSHPVPDAGCTYGGSSGRWVYCRNQCSCPEGFQYHSGIDVNGDAVSTCVPVDTGGEPGGDDCEYGADSNGVCYSEDCPFGDGTPEACSNNSSSSSSVPPVCVPPYYNDPVTGQCVTDDEEEDSSSSSSVSSEGSASSSGDGSSSGNASSSGDSGSSAGNDSGDGDGDGDSGGGGSSSGGGAGGGGGGSGSSAGAGECDPTAKNYLECLGTKELEIPTEGGSYDGVGTDSDSRIEELEGELNDLINQVTSEINDSIGVTLSGSGGLSDYTYSIKGVSVAFGWTRFASYLSLLGYAIIAAAYVAAFIIIMRH